MRSFLKLSAVILSLALLSGCAMVQIRHPADPSNSIKRVAILPMKNDTTDVEAPEFVRSKLIAAFQKRQYNVKPVEESDRLLRDQMGITLGGQLEMASIEQLRKVLDVEGVVFGTLMDFGEVTTGLYNVRKVRAKFKLVNTLTGESFWANGLGVKSEESSGGLVGSATALVANRAADDGGVRWITLQRQSKNRSVLEGLAVGLGTKLIAKATGTHLARETNEVIRRVTANLPYGPGAATVAGITPPAIAAAAPGIKMPQPPSFGHMDYGDRDFSAIMVSTSVDTAGKEIFSAEMPIAKAGKKIRVEMDLAKMVKGGEMPPAFGKTITIHRGDKKITYSIYPNKQRYMVYRETDEGYYKKPDVEKTRVGSETIDGHPTDKFKVKIKSGHREVLQGYIWNAGDLDGMTIKSEIKDDNYKTTTKLKNIVLKTPPGNLFELPIGYTEARGIMELMEAEK